MKRHETWHRCWTKIASMWKFAPQTESNSLSERLIICDCHLPAFGWLATRWFKNGDDAHTLLCKFLSPCNQSNVTKNCARLLRVYLEYVKFGAYFVQQIVAINESTAACDQHSKGFASSARNWHFVCSSPSRTTLYTATLNPLTLQQQQQQVVLMFVTCLPSPPILICFSYPCVQSNNTNLRQSAQSTATQQKQQIANSRKLLHAKLETCQLLKTSLAFYWGREWYS